MVAESFLPRVNGVSGSVLRSAEHLISLGHRVDIIAPAPAPARVLDRVNVHRVRSWTIPGMGVDVGYALAHRLRELLERLDPDVVHLASPLILGHQAIRAARDARIPTVAVFQTDITGFAHHYGLSSMAPLSDALIRKIHSEVNLTLAPSHSARAYLERLGVERVALWGRGVDAQQFSAHRRSAALRQQWLGGGGQTLTVGYVGRLAPEKSVSALRRLSADPHIRTVIVGDGPQRAELEQLMPDACFTGMLRGDELGAAMASLDVLVAPGEQETFCQVIQEAMAAQVPVVAPAVGGPRDLVHHGRTGLLYPPGDHIAMAASVRQLTSDPTLRRQMGTTARAIVSDRSWARIGDELLAHYASASAPSTDLMPLAA